MGSGAGRTDTQERAAAETEPVDGGRASWWVHAPQALGLAAWLAVALIGVQRARGAISFGAAGLDLEPVRDAGRALRSGHDIYTVHAFVYPPPAALVGWLYSTVSLHQAIVLYSYFEVAAVALTFLLLRRYLLPARWQLLASAVLAGIVLKGDIGESVLWLDNASVLLLLPCAFVVSRWGRGRWISGGVMLGATLVFKPVLLPLLLIPLLFRQWRAFWATVAVVGIGAVLSIPLAAQAGSLVSLARRIATGSNIAPAYNVSLSGIGAAHHVSLVLVITARVLIAGIALWGLAAHYRQMRRPTIAFVASMSTLLLCAVFLAGPSSESHYLLLLVPGAIMVVALKDRVTNGLLVLALLTAGYSSYYFGGRGDTASDLQIRSVVIELLLFGASLRALHRAARSCDDNVSGQVHAEDDPTDPIDTIDTLAPAST